MNLCSLYRRFPHFKLFVPRAHCIHRRFYANMTQIIECVPNFSEGRNQEVIDAIGNAIKTSNGVTLLDVDPGKSTNRTVYTFVGTQNAVIEAALAAARIAFRLIDMSLHSGEHPRLGALDVCPFIPVSNATMEDCVSCARTFSSKLAEELDVPVYLYGFASEKEYRKQVPQIRAGEYEGLRDKLKKAEWQPDFGSAKFIPKWGATIVGARKFLIAYNVNLLSTKEQAHRIALNIREQGRGPQEPGRLKQLQAIGWWYQENKIAQISTNLTDLDITTLHQVYEEAVKDAHELNLPIVGSEIVGLVPLKPMLQAAEYFIKKENLFILEDEQKIQLVVNRLGLNMLSPFDYKTRIIEYAVNDARTSNPLLNMSVKDFVCEVGARKPAPGGGSVAALVGSLGAGLCQMVGLLSSGSKKFEKLENEMRELIPQFHKAMSDLMLLVDLDTRAFNSIIEANRLPALTPSEIQLKEVALEKATRDAIEVPMKTGTIANSLWPCIKRLAEVANITAISDLQVGAKSLETAIMGAMWNVQINLTGLKTQAEKEDLLVKCADISQSCKKDLVEVFEMIEKRKQQNV